MGSDPIMSSSLTLFGFGGSMGQVAAMGARARGAEGSARGGRSLKQKSHQSGRFWFSDPKVRPAHVFEPKHYSGIR